MAKENYYPLILRTYIGSDPTLRIHLVAATVLSSLEDILAGYRGKQHTMPLTHKRQGKGQAFQISQTSYTCPNICM